MDRGGDAEQQRPGIEPRRGAPGVEPERGEDDPVAGERHVQRQAEEEGRRDDGKAGGEQRDEPARRRARGRAVGEERLQQRSRAATNSPSTGTAAAATGAISLSGMAKSGRPSTRAMELASSMPRRGLAPGGMPHGVSRKNIQPSVCMARSA